MISMLGQQRTCLNFFTKRQCSCLSPLRELSMSIIYLLQSLSAMHIFPSNSLWRIRILHYNVILTWMHISPILLGQTILNCVDWHLFVDYWQVQQLPYLYLHLLCQELTSVAHCCLATPMIWHPTCNGYRTMLFEQSGAFQCHLT